MSDLACIRLPMADSGNVSWCGKPAGGFILTGIDHAAACIIAQTYVQPCKECLKGTLVALAKGLEDV